MTASLDRRVHAVRADLADIALAGQVIAPRYAEAVVMQCGVATATMRCAPDPTSVAVSEVLLGEAFHVFDRTGPWAWGQNATDGYVGWVSADDLLAQDDIATVPVMAPQALLFAEPSIKSAVVATLPLGARLPVEAFDDSFMRTSKAFVHRRHLELPQGDAVDLAHAFIGTPYRWGGRTRGGIDCSGLVQTVLATHGVACPRDSDQQLAAFPEVPYADRRRGDLVGFPGHIGLLVECDHLLHANAYHMTTLVEPLADVVARLQPLHDKPVLGVVRPPCEDPGL